MEIYLKRLVAPWQNKHKGNVLLWGGIGERFGKSGKSILKVVEAN